MDINRLFQDYSIRYAHEGEKHYRSGWYNIPCPFCSGHSGNHLGYNLSKNYFKCWRCGFKSTQKVLMQLLGIPFKDANKLIKQYNGNTKIKEHKIKVVRFKFKMPDDIKPILKRPVAMAYLMNKRGFSRQDSIWIAKKFHLFATGCAGFLDEIDLSYRIIAPILFDNEVVSWQSRDHTNYSSLKYITCPAKIEKIEHKTILYNAPDPANFPFIILCEGIFDVWKVVLAGYPATCCFGVDYTAEQFLLLKKYETVYILFDPDNAGIKSAKKLMKQLIFAGKDAEIVKHNLGIDPGDMKVKQIQIILNKVFNFQ